MNKFDFDEKLTALRALYFEKHPIDPNESEVFTPLSLEEKEQKTLNSLQDCVADIAHLSTDIDSLKSQDAPEESIVALETRLRELEDRKLILEQKLEFILSGETDDQKKEKLKRQILELEVKRSKLKMAQKDCSKIDLKIKQRLDIYKKL
ncbi:hypothetical protein [Lactococcus sp.]|uniref:hypothetical protein n=1 Tax=Lactococcus sp. TaxID=44273 RepID=UPI0035B18A9B